MNQHIWRLKISIKIKIFIWLLFRKRLLTVDRLLNQGMFLEQHYGFCVVLTESCDHLFCYCVFARYLLLLAAGLDAPDEDSGDVRDLSTNISNIPDSAKRSNGLTLLVAIWWAVWMEKNNLTFRSKSPNAIRALERAKLLIKNWIELL